jgi:cellulose synthase/poly-beta-1,6-N-acetylglucosamine synthase-like glycosyltransferase
MEKYPFFSIIIPAKNEAALIKNCLQSLQQLNYPKDRFEVIISDGLSSDKTADIARSLGAKIIENRLQTVAPGRNVGFASSQGDLVAFSDADCVMDKNWLSNALKYFNDEGVGGLGGPSLAPQNETPFGRAVRFFFLLGSFLSGSVYVSDLKKAKEVKSVPGCNAIYRREALLKVMPSDETLLTCDDVEINYQLIKKGYKILYVPDVIVWHYRRDNPKKFWKQIYRYSIGRLQIGKKHGDAINLAHILSGLAIPIALFILTLSFIFNQIYFLYLIGAGLLATILLAVFSFIKEKIIKTALYVPLVVLIFVSAWSAGFLRELFFPIKKVAGK